MHFVYMVRCADDTLYTGYALNPTERERAHNLGRGARYTSGRRPVHLVYVERCASIGDALRRERRLKRWSRAKKEAAIAAFVRALTEVGPERLGHRHKVARHGRGSGKR